METRLTLSLDERVIKDAEEFAKKNHTSLSKMIERYFLSLTQKKCAVENNEISVAVKSLSGVLQLPDNFDLKEDRASYLEKKYLQ